MNYINSCYQSLENYTSKRVVALFDLGLNRVKNRLKLGVSLYPLILLISRIYKETESSIQCPPEIAKMSMIENIIGPVFITTGFTAMGVIEEFVCRELLQNGLREKVASRLEKSSPMLASYWKGTTGKVARIALMSCLFSTGHTVQYMWNGEVGTKGVNHVLKVIPLAVMTSALQEFVEGGSVSAMSLHATNNLVWTIALVYKIFSTCEANPN